ncbi:MAG: hypothetical protein CL596_05155 [Alteromonas sp.]|nr:hypothetical protein [Alteromonas sp.]|tara:strand:- start:16672 stop:17316 length:645 start_codon:yes stop_codon:yes gene_type:complete
MENSIKTPFCYQITQDIIWEYIELKYGILTVENSLGISDIFDLAKNLEEDVPQNDRVKRNILILALFENPCNDLKLNEVIIDLRKPINDQISWSIASYEKILWLNYISQPEGYYGEFSIEFQETDINPSIFEEALEKGLIKPGPNYLDKYWEIMEWFLKPVSFIDWESIEKSKGDTFLDDDQVIDIVKQLDLDRKTLSTHKLNQIRVQLIKTLL